MPAFTKLGIADADKATRRSPGNVSFGTPMIIQFPPCVKKPLHLPLFDNTTVCAARHPLPRPLNYTTRSLQLLPAQCYPRQEGKDLNVRTIDSTRAAITSYHHMSTTSKPPFWKGLILNSLPAPQSSFRIATRVEIRFLKSLILNNIQNPNRTKIRVID